MSSGIAPPAPPSSGLHPARIADVEGYIDRRVEETRRHVRAVDLTVALLRLAIGVLVYLMVAMVLDHWVVADGLGRGWRFLLWAVLILVGGGYCARYVVPLLIHRINPIFAAQTIERTRPSFKNGLINFLLLRREAESIQGDELARRVYQGLQVHTASELSRVTVGTTVDRLHVIRLGYLLATLVAVCCLYFVLSPKNPLASFGRVILPWARIGVPTRVSIEAVAPGDAVAYQGDTLVVSAEIRGLRAGEPVSLYYSSVDGHRVDQSVPMTVPEGGFRHQGELPPGSSGFQHSLLYWIAAGDATSPTFSVDVQIPPAIVVDRVEYDYPAYTGLPQRVAVREGDLRAIEGTRVTIHGAANYPVAKAVIELEGDSRPTVPMTADGSTAVGRLTLAMSRADPSQPEYRWYQLRFTDPERRENRRPIRHRIDVIPDQKPEVRFVEPPPDGMQLPVNGAWEFKVRAEDPDFGLRRVEWRAEREGRGLLVPPLLKKPRPEKPHQGPFEAVCLFQPGRLGLKPGDRVVYWAEAADCKEKADDPGFTGNVSETEKRTILIVAEDPRQQPDRARAKEDSPAKPPARQQGGADQKPSDAMQPGEQPPQSHDASDAPKGSKEAPPQGRKPPQPTGRPNPSPPESKPDDSGDDNEPGQPGPAPPKSGGKAGGKSDGQSDAKTGNADDRSKPGGSAKPSDSDQPSDSDSPQSNSSQGGKQGKATEASDRQGKQSPAPIDGDTNPGEAFERILEDQQRQQAQGQSGAREKQPQSDSMASDQEPGEAHAPPQAASGEQKLEGMKSGARPKKGDAGQMPDGQAPAGQEPSDAPPEAKKPEGQSPPKGQRPKPSADAPSMEGPRAEGQEADSGADDRGDKPEPGPKGATSKSPSSDSPKMDQEGVPGPKGERSPRGDAGEKKTAAAEKPEDSRSEDSPGQSKTAMDGPKGKQASKPAGKQAEAADGPESEKPADQRKDGTDAKSAKGGKDDQDAQGAKQQGSDADPKAGQTDPQAKSGEKTPPSKKNDQSSAAQRPAEEGQPADSMKGDEESNASQGGPKPETPKGADPSSRPEASGADQTPRDPSSMPPPAELKPSREPCDGKPGQGKNDEAKGGGPPSPSMSPKPSTAKSDSEGDRSADGKTGGGQQAKQAGEGTPGEQSPADQGNQGSPEKGEGEIGNKPGEQSMSDQAAGKPGDQAKAPGKGSPKPSGGDDPGKRPPNEPSRKDAEGAKSGQPQQDASAGKNPSQKGGSTSGNPTEGGGEPGAANPGAPPPAPPAPPPDDPNLEYTRKQTTLALEHLADQLAKDRSELLERLGWDRAYAENFLRQWEQMLRAANQPGPQGEAAKRELDKALKSLGLRPAPSQVQKAKTPADKLQQLQDAGRIPPPLEWRDYFKAYTEGVAGSKD